MATQISYRKSSNTQSIFNNALHLESDAIQSEVSQLGEAFLPLLFTGADIASRHIYREAHSDSGGYIAAEMTR